MSVVQSASVKNGNMKIKFNPTIDVATFINENFTLVNHDATPSNVVNPFETIEVLRDYDSIARVITLYFSNSLESSSTYTLTISNLLAVNGDTIPVTTIDFETLSNVNVPADEMVPVSEPVEVEDHSIRAIPSTAEFADVIYVTGNDEFHVESIKPAMEDAYYLSEGFNEGRIEIYFNVIPAANYISSDYFKVQKKLIGKALNRWELIDALVTSDPNNDLVVIYLPSTDDPSVYGEPDRVYYETGYKYRVRISGAIGPSVSAQEDIDQIDSEVPELGEWDGGAP